MDIQFYKLSIPEGTMFRTWESTELRKLYDMINKRDPDTYKIFRFNYRSGLTPKEWTCVCIENVVNWIYWTRLSDSDYDMDQLEKEKSKFIQ